MNADGHGIGGRGFMVSGSEDRRLRLWDLVNVDRTAVLSGLEVDSDRPTYRYVLVFSVVLCHPADQGHAL